MSDVSRAILGFVERLRRRAAPAAQAHALEHVRWVRRRYAPPIGAPLTVSVRPMATLPLGWRVVERAPDAQPLVLARPYIPALPWAEAGPEEPLPSTAEAYPEAPAPYERGEAGPSLAPSLPFSVAEVRQALQRPTVPSTAPARPRSPERAPSLEPPSRPSGRPAFRRGAGLAEEVPRKPSPREASPVPPSRPEPPLQGDETQRAVRVPPSDEARGPTVERLGPAPSAPQEPPFARPPQAPAASLSTRPVEAEMPPPEPGERPQGTPQRPLGPPAHEARPEGAPPPSRRPEGRPTAPPSPERPTIRRLAEEPGPPAEERRPPAPEAPSQERPSSLPPPGPGRTAERPLTPPREEPLREEARGEAAWPPPIEGEVPSPTPGLEGRPTEEMPPARGAVPPETPRRIGPAPPPARGMPLAKGERVGAPRPEPLRLDRTAGVERLRREPRSGESAPIPEESAPQRGLEEPLLPEHGGEELSAFGEVEETFPAPPPSPVPLEQVLPVRPRGASKAPPPPGQAREAPLPLRRGEESPARSPRPASPERGEVRRMPAEEGPSGPQPIPLEEALFGRPGRAEQAPRSQPPPSAPPPSEAPTFTGTPGPAVGVTFVRRQPEATPTVESAGAAPTEQGERGPAPAGGAQVDLEKLTDEVYRRIRERLRIERERSGEEHPRWR